MASPLNSTLRTLMAVVVAPIAVVPALLIAGVAARWVFPEMSAEQQMNELRDIAIFAGATCFAAMIAIGVPLHLMFSRRGSNSYTVYGAAGGVVGALFGAFAAGMEFDRVAVFFLMLCALCGLCVAIVARCAAGVFKFSEKEPVTDDNG